MDDGFIIDAEFGEDAENREIEALAQKSGATFKTVFGGVIHSRPAQSFEDLTRAYKLDDREQAAAWPGSLMGQISASADKAREMGLPDVPDQDRLEIEQQKASQFVDAYEAVSGVQMMNGARDGADGSAQLFAHERLKRAKSVPPMLMSQARELHESGISDYTESAIRVGEGFKNAGRDQRDAEQKPVRRKVIGDQEI
jgi:hypothetical protein